MRYKRQQAFFKNGGPFFHRTGFATITDPYAKVVNEARDHKREMDALINRWKRHARSNRLDKDKGPMYAFNNQLEILITHHSLKLTDQFSLSLEETTDLIKESKTHHDKDFHEQLRATNHRKMLNYCIQYQQELYNAGWKQIITPKNTPNELILGGIEDLAQTLALMFGEGSGGTFDIMYGDYHPRGTFYYFDRPEQDYITKGLNLLMQTLKKPIEDPFMNAAIIHNEFARGHLFDKDFGLLFCRLYMNFALMLTGHAPLVIDSSKKEEYIQLTQPLSLSNPLPLASFLAQSMNETYQKHILPILEDGVPFYIDLDSKQDYLEMLSEHQLAQNYFNQGNFEHAQVHIKIAQKCALALDGLTPLIMGTHVMRLFKLEEEIDMKLRDTLAQDERQKLTTTPTVLQNELDNKLSQIASFDLEKIDEKIVSEGRKKRELRPLTEEEKIGLQRALQEAEESRNKFSAY
jgi:hypothetical protein